MKLTDKTIRAAKPKDKPYKMPDGGGLYLLVNPNGAKYWRKKYRYGGKEKLLSFGTRQSTPHHDHRAQAFTEVYEALDWLEKNTPSTWGITLFRQGLEIQDWNQRAHYLREGYYQIQRFIAT